VFRVPILLLAAYLIPPLSIFWFVVHYGVDVPYWDEWEFTELFKKVATGSASFQDFFALHNEHRIFFPKLVITGLAFISHLNLKYEMYANVLLGITAFFLICKISFNQSEKQDVNLHLANFFSGLVLFSFVQRENWTWGIGITWFMVNAGVVACIFFLSSGIRSPWKRLLLGAICCTIATFSLANGLISWIAVLPLLLLSVRESQAFKKIISVWILLFVASCCIYFIGYSRPTNHPDPFFFLKHLLTSANYFFTLLGSPLLYFSSFSSIFGFLIFLNFGLFAVRCLRNPGSKFTQNAGPWISLGLFTILSNLMTTIGRAGFGVEQAFSPRYNTVSVLLPIALIQLWRLVFSGHARSKLNQTSALGVSPGFLGIGGILTFLVLIASINSLTASAKYRVDMLHGKACLEVVNYVERSPKSCLNLIYPDGNVVKERAKTLQQIGLRQFPQTITFVANPAKNYGYLDTPSTTDAPAIIGRGCINCDLVEAKGWAVLPDRAEPAQLVFLSYGSGTGTFFTSAYVNLDSPDIAKALQSDRFRKVRWAVKFAPDLLPLGETVIKAWVYDPDNKQFVKLNGAPKVRVEK
jgi:hypothetical protein